MERFVSTKQKKSAIDARKKKLKKPLVTCWPPFCSNYSRKTRPLDSTIWISLYPKTWYCLTNISHLCYKASCFHRNMIKEHHSIQISIMSHKTTNSFTFPQHSHRAFKFQPPQRRQIKSILFISPSTKTLRELLSNMT